MNQPDYALTTLHDGREVSTGSEEWKLECLAKYALARGSRGQIEGWLQAFALKNTPETTQQLRDLMNAIKRASTLLPAEKCQPSRQDAAHVTSPKAES